MGGDLVDVSHGDDVRLGGRNEQTTVDAEQGPDDLLLVRVVDPPERLERHHLGPSEPGLPLALGQEGFQLRQDRLDIVARADAVGRGTAAAPTRLVAH